MNKLIQKASIFGIFALGGIWGCQVEDTPMNEDHTLSDITSPIWEVGSIEATYTTNHDDDNVDMKFFVSAKYNESKQPKEIGMFITVVDSTYSQVSRFISIEPKYPTVQFDLVDLRLPTRSIRNPNYTAYITFKSIEDDVSETQKSKITSDLGTFQFEIPGDEDEGYTKIKSPEKIALSDEMLDVHAPIAHLTAENIDSPENTTVAFEIGSESNYKELPNRISSKIYALSHNKTLNPQHTNAQYFSLIDKKNFFFDVVGAKSIVFELEEGTPYLSNFGTGRVFEVPLDEQGNVNGAISEFESLETFKNSL